MQNKGNMGFIYVRPNLINGKKYVGQVITKRFKTRQSNWKNLKQPYAGVLINRARAKYGIEAFGFEILKECNDDELDYWEKYYIKELNTKAPYGYNMTDGGEGKSGCLLSEETRIKMSEKGKGRKVSQETRKKISEAKKDKKPSELCRKKQIEAVKGKKLSDEHKKKISEANKGKKLTEEAIRKRSEKMTNGKCSKPLFQIDKYTNEVIAEFPSTAEVERQLGFCHTKISSSCLGKSKSAYGYKWRYKEESAA